MNALAMTGGTKNHAAPECLGRIDAAIVDVLRSNGHITYKKLASLVHLSESPCQQRVRKLDRLGAIRGYGAFIDEHKLSPGLSLVVLVTWLESTELHLEKLLAYPQLGVIKPSSTHLGIE